MPYPPEGATYYLSPRERFEMGCGCSWLFYPFVYMPFILACSIIEEYKLPLLVAPVLPLVFFSFILKALGPSKIETNYLIEPRD